MTCSGVGVRAPGTRGWGGPVLLVVGILLLAANLRAGLTGVGPLLGDITAELRLSAAAAGLLNTLPLLAFAAVSPVAPAVAHRIGLERALLGALLALAAGLVLRSAPSVFALFAGTVLVGVAIALGNVLLPGLIKRDFPGSIGVMTGAYTTTMGLMAAVSSGVVVPISTHAPGGWRTALGCWALLAVLATLMWLPQTGRGKGARADGARARLPWHSPLAWAVTAFMGTQAFGFYVSITWLPSLLADQGLSPAAAGWQLFVFQSVALLANLGAPQLMRRLPDQRVLAAGASCVSLLGYLGVLLLPELATVWSGVMGIGAGACVVVALSLFSLRAPDAGSAAALSAMAQTVGYLFAAAGPVFVGLLHSVSDGWVLPVTALCVVASLQACIGIVAGHGLVRGARS